MLKKIGTTRLGYDDIKYDDAGWADAKKFTPFKFDLVNLKTDNKIINGWYDGDKWVSLRLRDKDDVIYWKKVKEAY